VYLLGAGFSAEAGLPTIAEFLNQMRDSADWLTQQGRLAELTAVDAVLEFRHNAHDLKSIARPIVHSGIDLVDLGAGYLERGIFLKA
jgi:hypothetical protein